MNLSQLEAALRAAPADAELAFETAGDRLSAGCHVTELKLAQITSIDCGSRLASFPEATLQLLRGTGEEGLRVGKLARILSQSLGAIDGLGAAPLRIEFPATDGSLQLSTVQDAALNGAQLVVRLAPAWSVCKPAQDGGAAAAGCCSKPAADAPGPAAKSACCG